MEREVRENGGKRRAAILAVGVCCMAAVIGGYVRYGSREGVQSAYPMHDNVVATVFWVGESADASNDYIPNRSSFWTGDWVGAYGGIDDPEDRCGYRPCDFVPRENAFYVAVPYADTQHGVRKPESDLTQIPWYDGVVGEGVSLIKNRWVEVTYDDRVAYAQVEDVGPFREDDLEYVFGDEPPEDVRAGLDLSPATADYLALEGRGIVSWRFVDADAVPDGPWRDVVTVSDPAY